MLKLSAQSLPHYSKLSTFFRFLLVFYYQIKHVFHYGPYTFLQNSNCFPIFISIQDMQFLLGKSIFNWTVSIKLIVRRTSETLNVYLIRTLRDSETQTVRLEQLLESGRTDVLYTTFRVKYLIVEIHFHSRIFIRQAAVSLFKTINKLVYCCISFFSIYTFYTDNT